jgi:hypothetical protein
MRCVLPLRSTLSGQRVRHRWTLELTACIKRHPLAYFGV